MPQIPTSMSARLHPFLSVLIDAGTPFSKYSTGENLSPEIFERRDVRFALPLVYAHLADVENREGIDDLAFRGVLRDGLECVEDPYRQRFEQACTVMVCLLRYISSVRQYNGRRAGLNVGSKFSWFSVFSIPGAGDGDWRRFTDWSNVYLPISILREAFGRSWEPKVIWLETNCVISETVQETFPNACIQSGQRCSGFSIPTSMLSWRMPSSLQPGLSNETSATTGALSKLTFDRAFQELVVPYLSEPSFGVDIAAEIAGMSKRTLQRSLANSGTSFRETVAQSKYAKAANLLADSDSKIIEVSLEVGYDDPSHFARAFKKMSGVSPRRFRNIAAHSA